MDSSNASTFSEFLSFLSRWNSKIHFPSRWTPTSSKWRCNPYKWLYTWVTGIISYNPYKWSYDTLLITGRGPLCERLTRNVFFLNHHVSSTQPGAHQWSTTTAVPSCLRQQGTKTWQRHPRGGGGFWLHIPDAPCKECLPTFTINLSQM